MSIFRSDLFAGRAALITGGGTGLGYAIAETFVRLGGAVALASRKAEHVEPAAERLRATGGRAMAVLTDVRNPEAVRESVRQVADELGRIDVLVNNAAGNFYAPSAELTPNGWRAVVETDLYGTFFCSQAVHPIMKAQGGGRIISISMTLHYRGWPQMAHATAAKAGVDALTRTLALEWAPDRITVNAVAPGPIPTEGATRAFQAGASGDGPSLDDAMRRTIPLGRMGRPDEIGAMVAYLASPAAEWITGSIFVVDGGSSLWQPFPA